MVRGLLAWHLCISGSAESATLETSATAAFQRQFSKQPVFQDSFGLQTIVTVQSTRPWAPLVAQHVESARHGLARTFGRVFLTRVEVQVIPSHEDYLALAGHSMEHSIAAARPSQQLVLISADELGRTSPGEVASTILHEMVHLFFGIMVQDPPLPLWLDEGLAQIVADPPNPKQLSTLAPLALSGRNLRLSHLVLSFPTDEHRRRIAYLQARAITEFLIREDYQGSLHRFAQDLISSEGPAIVADLRNDFTATALEGRWISSMGGVSLFALMTLHLEVLMGIAFGLLMVGAWVNHRRRRWNRELDAEQSRSRRGVKPGTDYDRYQLTALDPQWPLDADFWTDEP
jgi:hypothetical protein